jgi:hypothetical protein
MVSDKDVKNVVEESFSGQAAGFWDAHIQKLIT